MTFCLMVLALEVLRECPMGVENKKGTDKSGVKGLSCIVLKVTVFKKRLGCKEKQSAHPESKQADLEEEAGKSWLLLRHN